MKRLRIEHETGFRYSETVTASYNEARMLPGTTDSQFVLSANLEIRPQVPVSSYADYFGTRVSSFDVLTPHTELMITSRSLVEVRAAHAEAVETTWERLARDVERDVETVEHLAQTDRTRPHPEVADIAREIARRHDDPAAAATAIATTLGDAVSYVRGVTGVHSTAADAWDKRQGVCQDITHLVIGGLRAAGIPARYVSGYLHPRENADIGVAVATESHAWVEYFAGGWHGFDATAGAPSGDRHVLVGRGRDYGDVPPLRGVYAGPCESELHVRVTITREA
ncbi:transglutaminase family protein [Microbacterium sp. NPDC055683]